MRPKSRNWPLHRGCVSGWLRGAAITSAAGIRMSTHLYPEMAAHLMRVTDTAHSQEWQDLGSREAVKAFYPFDIFCR